MSCRYLLINKKFSSFNHVSRILDTGIGHYMSVKQMVLSLDVMLLLLFLGVVCDSYGKTHKMRFGLLSHGLCDVKNHCPCRQI